MAEPPPTIEPTPIAEPLDNFLQHVVQTLHAAVNQGVQNLQENPPASEKVLKDCEEMLAIIMQGNVKEWIG